MSDHVSTPVPLGPRGTALYRQYADAYDLDPSSLEVLLSACECVDLLAELDFITKERGPLDTGGRIAPHVTEGRFQRGVLLKLTAQLERLAEPADGSRRNLGGTRGSYGVRAS